jgi:UDP-GlcNAc:undecaprenyl-phosphate GlcNAc-1-phosphate transferase
VLGLVAVMNVVNLSDGADGLAAGVCAISAITFSIIAFDLDRNHAAVFAAITAGAALGFLIHNFHPASVYMGDCGSNLLGCCSAASPSRARSRRRPCWPCSSRSWSRRALPGHDVRRLKRMKYRRPIYRADANHFHHRLSRIGFSQRRTVLYLYAWTILLGGFAVAAALRALLRPPRPLPHGLDGRGRRLRVLVIAASIYLVYVLEILKFKRLDAMRLRRMGATEAEIDEDVQRRLETGEFEQVRRETEEFDAVRE